MAEFSYDLSVTLDPPKAAPGALVTATVKASNVKGEIKAVYAMINPYGYSEVLPKTGDDTYSIKVTVPYDAPPGTYQVSFFARDASGNRGKDVVVPFTVT